jgi:hypothetical protein
MLVLCILHLSCNEIQIVKKTALQFQLESITSCLLSNIDGVNGTCIINKINWNIINCIFIQCYVIHIYKQCDWLHWMRKKINWNTGPCYSRWAWKIRRWVIYFLFLVIMTSCQPCHIISKEQIIWSW